MHISNYLSHFNVKIFAIQPILRPVDVILDKCYLINVFSLFMLIIKANYYVFFHCYFVKEYQKRHFRMF